MNELHLFILIFGGVLFVASLLSEYARNTWFSSSVLFLIAGFALGSFNVIRQESAMEAIPTLSTLVLLAVLFTDGMHAHVGILKKFWRISGLVLALGMPITILLIAVVVRLITELPWIDCFIVGAVLAPTDPVFAASMVQSKIIPEKFRHMLNIESGLNDGIALPIVIVLIQFAQGHWDGGAEAGLDVLRGVILGPLVTVICLWILDRPYFKETKLYGQLFTLSIFLLVYSVTEFFKGNIFLAVFLSGSLIASHRHDLMEGFHRLSNPVVEVLKLISLMIFGIIINWTFFLDMSWKFYLCSLIILFIVRPLTLGLVLFRSDFTWKERLGSGWFGPRGFASVIFALYVLHKHVPEADEMFHLMATTIALSIILHSSTDVPVAKWFERNR